MVARQAASRSAAASSKQRARTAGAALAQHSQTLSQRRDFLLPFHHLVACSKHTICCAHRHPQVCLQGKPSHLKRIHMVMVSRSPARQAHRVGAAAAWLHCHRDSMTVAMQRRHGLALPFAVCRIASARRSRELGVGGSAGLHSASKRTCQLRPAPSSLAQQTPNHSAQIVA